MKNPEHHAVAAAMIIPQIFMSAKSTPFPVVAHSALKPWYNELRNIEFLDIVIKT